ncbi:helicase [Legionella birminghamensis]|uniref:Helicase n=1 Tax=Legionella birminghamensis TaxID=28083 RepID=A0A378IA16_9GAMM|nr:LirA/MavJ family T4SS effector [Legionella birminghamensis]KTC68905.1 helicase [Legionella birminghamensis]STX31421.1 helicase [Legionella birminghamensis]
MQLITTGSTDENDYKQYLDDTGFPDLDQDLEDDVIKVLSFLCNEEKMLEGLKQFAKQYYDFKQLENKEGRTDKHSLRKFFDEWGRDNHFNQGSTEPVPAEFRSSPGFNFPKLTAVLIDEVSAELFLDVLLKNAYLSSDPGAGVTHGKWSHSIQLFILEEARKSGILKLNTPTVAEFITRISQVKPQGTSFTLWYVIFDSTFEETFTCPDAVARTLYANFDRSKESLFLSNKLKAYKEKVEKANSDYGSESAGSRYSPYVEKSYASRMPEYGYIEADRTRGLLWFSHKKAVNVQPEEVSLNTNQKGM